MASARSPSISGSTPAGKHHFEVRAGLFGPVRQNLDRRDIPLVLRDHTGQSVQHAGGRRRHVPPAQWSVPFQDSSVTCPVDKLKDMVRPEAGAAIFVERFFQFSVLGLVTSGYLAVASSGYLDAPTLVLAGAGLLFRGLVLCGLVRIAIPERVSTFATLFYSAFFVADCFLISKAVLPATVHLVFFIAVVAHPDGPHPPRRFDDRGGGFPGTGGGGDSLDRPELFRVPGGVSGVRDGGADQRGNPPLDPAIPGHGAQRAPALPPQAGAAFGVDRGGNPGAYSGAVFHPAAHSRRGFRAAALAPHADAGLRERSGAGRGGRH